MSQPTKEELAELQRTFDDNYAAKFKAGDEVVHKETGAKRKIIDTFTYEGVWYDLEDGSTLENAYDFDKDYELAR